MFNLFIPESAMCMVISFEAAYPAAFMASMGIFLWLVVEKKDCNNIDPCGAPDLIVHNSYFSIANS